MQAKNIKSYVKFLNKKVLKLNWLFIIMISLLLLLFIQLYRSTSNNQTIEEQDRLEQAISSLDKKVMDQKSIIDTLEKKVESLEKHDKN